MSSIIKNINSVTALLSDVKYKDWAFSVRESVGGFLLSVSIDAETGSKVSAVTAKFGKPLSINEWYISRFATDTEVVRTAYKAVMYIEMFVCEHAQFIDINKYNDLSMDMDEAGDRERAAIVLASFDYKNWKVRTEEREDGIMVQIVFEAPDNDNPDKMEMQHCRKFFYRFGDLDELFVILQYAIKSAEEHECNEMFLYKGKQIYNPHMDLDAIAEFIDANEFDHR